MLSSFAFNFNLRRYTEDDDHPGDNGRNIQLNVTFLEFKTRDVTPPVWAAAYPTLFKVGCCSLQCV